ncbi:hypothetical protein Tco_0439461 [Tanacetum coccineum]
MMNIYDDRVKDVCEPKSNDDSPTSTIVEEFESLLGDIIRQKEEVKGISDPVARRKACFNQGRVIHSPKKASIRSEMILEEEIDEFLKHDESLNMNLNDEFNDEDGDIIFLEKLLEDENFFQMNDKKVESFERKTKEDFETKVEPEKKKELQVFHPDIEILNHFENTSYVGSDYVFYEDFSLVDMLFPVNIQGKVFDPGITFHEKSFEKDDKSSKELVPSKALLTLDVFDPLHPPLMNFHVTKAFFGFTFSLLKIFSKKFFEPGIKNATVYLSIPVGEVSTS